MLATRATPEPMISSLIRRVQLSFVPREKKTKQWRPEEAAHRRTAKLEKGEDDLEDEEEDGLVLDSSSRQKDETIQALSEMNELWCLKLSDLIDQYDDIIEEQYQQRMKKPSKED